MLVFLQEEWNLKLLKMKPSTNGISGGKIDDPNKKSILALFNEIHILSEKINKLKSKVSNFPLSDKKINLGKKEKQKYKGKIEK